MNRVHDNIFKPPCINSKQVLLPNKVVLIILTLGLFSLSANAQQRNPDTLLIAYELGNLNNSSALIENSEKVINSKESAPAEIPYKNYLSGDWWGFRNSLSGLGFEFELVYKGETFSNISGGLKSGATSLDNIDLIFTADLMRSLGLKNTNLKVQLLGNSGGVPCDFVGALQGISNIETVPTWKLYQLLLEKKFFDNQLSVQVGLLDLNSEFDVRETSSIFINPSHGIGPDYAQSGLNGPSIFPTTSVALRFKYESEAGNYFQTAIFDGVPGNPDNPFGTHIIFDRNDGVLFSTEIGIIRNADDKLDSKIALGAWTYTKDSEKNNFTNFDENIVSLEKNYGFYFSAEKLLTAISLNSASELSVFLRIGYANADVNPVDLYVGSGLRVIGLLEGRDEDELGFAFAYAHCSSAFRTSSAILENIMLKPYELNFEITYIYHLTPWLIIQPDIQYIINPAYSLQSGSALVVGTRMQITF